MAKSAAERMRAYRIRKNPYGRKAGRPRKKIRIPTTRRFGVLVNIISAVWTDLRKEGIEDISFRSLRRRANAYSRKPLPSFEIGHFLYTQYGTDHFYCEGESQAGLPLSITVTDPV